MHIKKTMLDISPIIDLFSDGIGDQLCKRVLSVLFEMWLLACTKYFPSPPLWKTFRDMCANWRHHEALVIQWYRVNVALSAKLLAIMYGPEYPKLHASRFFISPVSETLA